MGTTAIPTTARTQCRAFCHARVQTRPGLNGRVAVDWNAWSTRRDYPSVAAAVGIRVEVNSLVLCHTVRAGVCVTARGGPMGPTHGSEGRCSFWVNGTTSWELAPYETALGSYQKSIFDKSTILTPLPTPRGDVGKIWVQFWTLLSRGLRSRLTVDRYKHGSRLYQSVGGLDRTSKLRKVGFSRPFSACSQRAG